MSKIAIITAMDEELEAIKNKFKEVEKKELRELIYYEGEASKKERG